MQRKVIKQNTRKQFRFQRSSVHLTYRTHIPHNELIQKFSTVGGGYRWYSVVHETGHAKSRKRNSDEISQPEEIRGNYIYLKNKYIISIHRNRWRT